MDRNYHNEVRIPVVISSINHDYLPIFLLILDPMKFHIVIPARFNSTRLPGKPLLDIVGKPMIQHVYERAVESGAADVCVATDDERILRCVEGFGGRAIMTAEDHPSGVDRVAEVVRHREWPDEAIVVNLQGDEPLMEPALVNQLARALHQHSEAGIATLATPITERNEIFKPEVVKVVTDKAGWALYFSRAPIPWVRGDYEIPDQASFPDHIEPRRHLGLYAYRVRALKALTAYDPCSIERAESLEQLRALWHGIRIHVSVIQDVPAPGVDTPQDLETVRTLLMHRDQSYDNC